MSQLLALASSVLYGAADFAGGIAAKTVSSWRVVAWSQVFGFGLLVVAVPIVGYERVPVADLGWGAAAGIAGVIGVYALYRALAEGTMSIVSPATAALTAVLPLVVGLLLGERITATQWLGILIALGAITLVVYAPTDGAPSRSVIVHALIASIGFAAFFIVLNQTSEDSGLWPLIAARSVSIPLALTLAAVTATASIPGRASLRPVIIAGVADMAANITVLLSLQTGPLGVNTVLIALYPAFTAIAAVIVLRERPSKPQLAGIALALLAAALLAL